MYQKILNQNGFSRIAVIVVSAILVLAIGISAYCFYQYYYLPRKEFNGSPDKLLTENPPSDEEIYFDNDSNPPGETGADATTTDPTANWKTYTNDEYGFSFKYPYDRWYVMVDDYRNYDGIEDSYMVYLKDQNYDPVLNIGSATPLSFSLFQNVNHLTPKDYMSNYWNNYTRLSDGKKYTNSFGGNLSDYLSITKYHNNEVYVLDLSKEKDFLAKFYFFIGNNTVAKATGSGDKYFDQIFSTLEFTK